jgi:hypothetical protein
MSNPAELALVEKALTSRVDGCVLWHPKQAALVRRAMKLLGLTPEFIQEEVIRHVQGGGRVRQVKESREKWKDERDYYYKVIVPMPDLFAKGLFVEMELLDDDLDLPEVRLVNAHEQK